MNKKLLFAALISMIITVAVSCKKEDKPFKDALSNTTWVGTVSSVDNATQESIAILFGEDKKVTFLNGGFNNPALNDPDAEEFVSTYTFVNNTLTFTLFADPDDPTEYYSFSGTVKGNSIEGTFTDSLDPEGGGNFNVTKQ